jgi:glycosyltransferase involved in cell wall biosynthesis
MKILHVSTNDIGGGAAIAAHRLHKGLRLIGEDSQMLVSQKLSDDPNVLAPAANLEKLWSRLATELDQFPRRFLTTPNPLLLSPAWIPSPTLSRVRRLQPDVVNLHWIAGGFVNPASLALLAETPVVWTLHDMWAFCGAEHYTGGDDRYIKGYTPTNRPRGESGFDLNRWTWQRKLLAITKLQRLTIVADSRWLAGCARQSVMFHGRRVEAVNYGLDHTRFRPIPKAAARQILGVPEDKVLILFGAINAAHDVRKGIDLLAAALHQFATNASSELARRVECMVFGSSAPRNPVNFGFPTTYLGGLSDEIALAVVYAAADVMIVPSREEAFGQTALEALACGTPVAAFDIGGLPDSVEHKRNGYLARPFDTAELAYGIQWITEDKHRYEQLAIHARAKVLAGFTLEHQARRYATLYQELISVPPAP